MNCPDSQAWNKSQTLPNYVSFTAKNRKGNAKIIKKSVISIFWMDNYKKILIEKQKQEKEKQLIGVKQGQRIAKLLEQKREEASTCLITNC